MEHGRPGHQAIHGMHTCAALVPSGTVPTGLRRCVRPLSLHQSSTTAMEGQHLWSKRNQGAPAKPLPANCLYLELVCRHACRSIQPINAQAACVRGPSASSFGDHGLTSMSEAGVIFFISGVHGQTGSFQDDWYVQRCIQFSTSSPLLDMMPGDFKAPKFLLMSLVILTSHKIQFCSNRFTKVCRQNLVRCQPSLWFVNNTKTKEKKRKGKERCRSNHEPIHPSLQDHESFRSWHACHSTDSQHGTTTTPIRQARTHTKTWLSPVVTSC